MLPLIIPANELWDERRQEFVQIDSQVLELEHSLVSLSNGNPNGIRHFYLKSQKHMRNP